MDAKKIGIALLALIGVVIVVFMFYPSRHLKVGSTDVPKGSENSARVITKPAQATPVSTVSVHQDLPKVQAHVSSPLLTQLLASSDLKNMLDKIRAQTAVPLHERQLYEAIILERCAEAPELVAKSRPEIVDAIKSGTMNDLIAKVSALAKNDRQREAIRKNMEGRLIYVCRNFGENSISQEDVERAFAAAAASGDLVAQARMVQKRMAESALKNADNLPDYAKAVVTQGGIGFADPITPAEQGQLLSALFSQDPIAIREAGYVMSLGSERQSLRIGADKVDIGANAAETWTLVACQFGFDCGSSNATVIYACAEQLRCADDYEAYLREFAMTPQDFLRVQNNAHIIAEAIRRRDTSAFSLVNSPGQVRSVIGTATFVPIH